MHLDEVEILCTKSAPPAKDMPRSLIYVGQPESKVGWYEAQLSLSNDPSSVVRSFKTLCFPSNKIGEVTDEEFELLKLHGHIGEGRLQLAEELRPVSTTRTI